MGRRSLRLCAAILPATPFLLGLALLSASGCDQSSPPNPAVQQQNLEDELAAEKRAATAAKGKRGGP